MDQYLSFVVIKLVVHALAFYPAYQSYLLSDVDVEGGPQVYYTDPGNSVMDPRILPAGLVSLVSLVCYNGPPGVD